MSSDSEDSFADPHPPGYKQPQPLSTHTHQMLTGWIQTEKPTAGPTPPPTTGKKKGLHQLHFSPQVGFKSSRRPAGMTGPAAGAARPGAAVVANRGSTGTSDKRDWQPGRSDYRVAKESPVLRLQSRNKAGDLFGHDTDHDHDDPGMIPVRPLVATPVGTTRRPITPPDEEEMDAMFSLRSKDKGKAKATLSQMRRVNRDENRDGHRDSEIAAEGGRRFPETVADSHEEGEENDVFGLPRSGRPNSGAGTTKENKKSKSSTRDVPDEAQESIMFLGQRNATASSSKNGLEAISRKTGRRPSQANAVQTKLSGFLKPLTVPDKPRPKSKRVANRPGATAPSREEEQDEVERPRRLSKGEPRPSEKRMIIENRAGPRAVLKRVDTQDIVPDSQTLDEELWNNLPLEEEDPIGGAEEDPGANRLPRSDSGEDLDHAIRAMDETIVLPFALTRPSHAEVSPDPPEVGRYISNEEDSSDVSMRGSSDDELHSLAYRDEVMSSASKRQINRTSATVEDDESYRPVGFVLGGSRSRRIPLGQALLRPKSGLRAMMQASASPVTKLSEEEAPRSTRSTRSIRFRPKGEPANGACDALERSVDSDTDSDSSVVRNDVDVELANAARAATEKTRLKRTTSGGSSRTSVTASLFDASSLTPLPSDDEEGPDVIQVMAPDLHRDSALLEMMGASISDADEQNVGSAHPGGDFSHRDDALHSMGRNRSEDPSQRSLSTRPMAISDETLPGTYLMDDAASEASIGDPAATLPPSFVHDMEPSLLGGRAALASRWQNAGLQHRESDVDPGTNAAGASMPSDSEPSSCQVLNGFRSDPSWSFARSDQVPEFALMKTPTPPARTRDRSASPFVTTATPPASKATEALRTPRRQPLRDLGFAVPILGQPRTPIRPASTRKFMLASPRSPVTPSKATPARAGGLRPGSAVKSPSQQEEWVDNVETLATWSPAKFESYYTLPQTHAGGSSLRMAFEETLLRDARAPSPIATKEINAIPDKAAANEHGCSPRGHTSSDSTNHSDGTNGKSSLRSQASSLRKRKLPGSEDDTIPGTYQNSGPSLHLLQSIPTVFTPAPKRVRKSDHRKDKPIQEQQFDMDATPKAVQANKSHLRQTPVMDPGNPLATPQIDRTPRAFRSVTDAWAGVIEAQEPALPDLSKKAPPSKYHDGKEQTSLQAFGYFKQQSKKEPTRKLTDYDRDFREEHDVEPEPASEESVDADDLETAAAQPLGRADDRGLARVPLPPMDPRLRKQGRQVVQQMLDEESNRRTNHPVHAVADPPRPELQPMQSAPRSDPHEARIYNMEDLLAPNAHNDDLVPSSQQGENFSPLRSFGSSGRRSTDDGSSYRTMEPPGEETQLWWKNMTDLVND